MGVRGVAHGPWAFKLTEVKRAVKAIADTGQRVAGVKFDPGGGFTVLVGEPTTTAKPNPWDDVELDFGKKDNG